jgi:hypothetical protein
VKKVSDAFFLASVLAAFAAQPPPNTLTAREKSEGWILLFDGKTFQGWDDPTRKPPPSDAWTIEDGAIKAVRQPRVREDILTTRRFRDFELAFDWRVAEGANSGVKYRVQDVVVLVRGRTKPGATRFEETVDYEYEHRLGDRSRLGPDDRVEAYTIGFEYQVIDDARHPDARRGARQQAGALYSMMGPAQSAARPAGEWNQARIVLRGKHAQHWLNGVKVVDVMLDAPEVVENLARRWGRSSPVYRLLTAGQRPDCPIALQNHNDETWFRNLKIRPLD